MIEASSFSSASYAGSRFRIRYHGIPSVDRHEHTFVVHRVQADDRNFVEKRALRILDLLESLRGGADGAQFRVVRHGGDMLRDEIGEDGYRYSPG